MRNLGLFLILFFGCAACAADAYRIDKNFEDKPFIYSPEDAIRAYAGEWDGAQDISIHKGPTLAMVKVSQSYRKIFDGSLSCTLTAYSGSGTIAQRKGRVYIEGDTLVWEEADDKGRYKPAYVGVTRSGDVVWYPFFPFESFYRQTDSFIGIGDFASIQSEGLKYEIIPRMGFKGLMNIRGLFTRKQNESVKPTRPLRFGSDRY